MKLLFSVIFLIFIMMGCGKSQQTQNTQNKQDNLIHLCKLWGFLKYYHPEVGAGNTNWDSTLLVCLDKIIKIKNQDSIKLVFDELVPKYNGSLNEKTICDSANLFEFNRNIQWMYDSSIIFPETLVKLLKLLRAEEYLNKYVSANEWVKNPIFNSDTSYNNLIFPGEKIRLLSLFRYWNIINYYFPYKYLIDSDWDKILEIFVPRMLNINDTLEYHLAICELTAMINENHGYTTSSILSAFWGSNYLPVKFEIIEGKTVISEVYADSLANENNLFLGDIILEINNLELGIIRDSLQKFFSGSHTEAVQHTVSYYLTRSSDTSIALKILRNDTIIQITSTAYPRKIIRDYRVRNKSSEMVRKYSNGITYINLSKLEYNDIDSVIYNVIDSKVLILDLRNNCEFIVHGLCKVLFEDQKEFFQILRPIYKQPGLYCFVEGDLTGPEHDNTKHFKGEIVVIVNQDTQSIGEFTTMALKAYSKTTLIGNNTAGADGNVSSIFLPGRITTYISGIGIYWPNRGETQRIGITPDIKVYRTIESVMAGEDNVFQEAYNYSLQLISNL